MSGIVGIYRSPGEPVDPAELQAMLRCTSYRGPDRTGLWRKDAVGLGHCLLRTTPESSAECQPLVSQDGQLALAADVRLDNREELTAALHSRRVEPADGSDAALILSAYEAWGEDCPGRLLGDFAFALWDGRRQHLFCARDPLGCKPFFYTNDARGFRFASAIGALYADGRRPWKPNLRLMLLWLLGRFEEPEETLDDGVLRLPAAHCLTVRPGQWFRRRYWDIDPGRQLRYRDDPEYAEHFLHLFRDAVRVRLRSAGPVAANLSGGLDSSSVVCTASRLQHEGQAAAGLLRPHSLAYEGYACDEKSYIAAVTAQEGLPTELHEHDRERYWMEFDRARDFPDVLFLPTLLAQGAILRSARGQGARVLLTGMGGDDLLMVGLEPLTDLWRQRDWRRLATRLRRESVRCGRSRARLFSRYCLRPALPLWARRTARAVLRPLRGNRLPAWIAVDRLHELGVPVRPEPPARRFPTVSRQVLHDGLFASWSANAAHLALECYCSHFGLEVRHPFLDRRLVEFAHALPVDQRCDGVSTKRVLRAAMTGILPESIRNRKNKAEFSCIVDEELRSRQAARLADLVRHARLADWGLLRREGASRLLAGYLHGPVDPTSRRACQFLLFLELWCATAIEKPTREPRPRRNSVMVRSPNGRRGRPQGKCRQRSRLPRQRCGVPTTLPSWCCTAPCRSLPSLAARLATKVTVCSPSRRARFGDETHAQAETVPGVVNCRAGSP
jgi:asparagine synthase (glutamine-hydrolysing)